MFKNLILVQAQFWTEKSTNNHRLSLSEWKLWFRTHPTNKVKHLYEYLINFFQMRSGLWSRWWTWKKLCCHHLECAKKLFLWSGNESLWKESKIYMWSASAGRIIGCVPFHRFQSNFKSILTKYWIWNCWLFWSASALKINRPKMANFYIDFQIAIASKLF